MNRQQWEQDFDIAVLEVTKKYNEFENMILEHVMAFSEALKTLNQILERARLRQEFWMNLTFSLITAGIAGFGGRMISNAVGKKITDYKDIDALQQRLKNIPGLSHFPNLKLQEIATATSKMKTQHSSLRAMFLDGLNDVSNELIKQSIPVPKPPSSEGTSEKFTSEIYFYSLAKINLNIEQNYILDLLQLMRKNTDLCVSKGIIPSKILKNIFMMINDKGSKVPFSDMKVYLRKSRGSLSEKYEKFLWYNWFQSYCIAESKVIASFPPMTFWGTRMPPKECINRIKSLGVTDYNVDNIFIPKYDANGNRRSNSNDQKIFMI